MYQLDETDEADSIGVAVFPLRSRIVALVSVAEINRATGCLQAGGAQLRTTMLVSREKKASLARVVRMRVVDLDTEPPVLVAPLDV